MEPSPQQTRIVGPARRILELLRLHGPMSASELSRHQGSGAVAVRAILRNLRASGLVARTEERRTVGRPVGRYHLTRAADAAFPNQYELLASHLVEALVAEGGRMAFETILARWEEDLAAHFDATLPAEPAARLAALAAHQSAHGFMAEVRNDTEGVALVERNCPIAAIARRHPEICDHEAALLGRALKWKTTLVSCQARGGETCVFRIGRARGVTDKWQS